MGIDITSMRVAEVSDLPVKRADGTIMMQEDGKTPVTATTFGPGTKIWQVANAAMNRASIKRTREANGKWEASVDNTEEDQAKFLCAIVKRFNGLDYPGVDGDKPTVEAVFADPLLGYIRDNLITDTRNWENFMKASQSLANATPGTSPG